MVSGDGEGLHPDPNSCCMLESKQIVRYRQTMTGETLSPVGNLLGKFYAELSEVFSRGSQIVADDGDVLFNVENH